MRPAIILLLLLVMQLAYPASSYTQGSWSRECTIHIAAVSSSGRGVVSNLTVRVEYPGSGRVYISTSPATEIDTQGAARIAAFASTLVLGLDFNSYNFYYQLDAPSIIVGGPSAGAAMAAATIAALQGVECSTNNVATGMVYVDSTIGPVGGLKEKLEAVAETGGKAFIVPKGQLVYTSYERVVERIGPFAIVRAVPVKVNLSSEGERLGVKVLQAGTVSDVARNLLGNLLGIEIRVNASRSPAPAAGLEDVYRELRRVYDGLVEDVPRDRGLRGYIEEARHYRDEAEDLASKGLYMPATQLISSAISRLKAAYWVKEVAGNNMNATPVIARVEEELNKTIDAVYTGRSESTGMAGILLWVAVSEYRDAVSRTTNGTVGTVLTIRGRVMDTTPIELLAEAYTDSLRARLIAGLDWPEPVGIDGKSLVLASLAKSVTAYASSLLQEAGRSSAGVDIAAELTVSSELEEHRVVSAYLSMAAAALATAAIHALFDGNLLLGDAEAVARYLASETGSRLASALLQNYEYYKSIGEVEAAWRSLDLAILASWMLLKPTTSTPNPQTASGAPTSHTVTVTKSTTETITRIEGPPQLSTLVVGLLIGILIGSFIGITSSRRS